MQIHSTMNLNGLDEPLTNLLLYKHEKKIMQSGLSENQNLQPIELYQQKPFYST